MAWMTEMRFELALAEAQQAQMRARYQEQRINTGIWKDRIGKVRQGGLDGPPVPEEQLLRDEVGIMHRHIQLAQDHLENAKGQLADHQEQLDKLKGK